MTGKIFIAWFELNEFEPGGPWALAQKSLMALKKKLADARDLEVRAGYQVQDRDDGIIQARDKTIEDLKKALASAGSADGGHKELIDCRVLCSKK